MTDRISPTEALRREADDLLDAGDHARAVAVYERALALDPSSALAWLKKGNALHGLQRYEDALACYDRALAIDSRLALAWYHKGDELGRQRRIIEARACFENARDLGIAGAAAMVAKCEGILMNEWYA